MIETTRDCQEKDKWKCLCISIYNRNRGKVARAYAWPCLNAKHKTKGIKITRIWAQQSEIRCYRFFWSSTLPLAPSSPCFHLVEAGGCRERESCAIQSSPPAGESAARRTPQSHFEASPRALSDWPRPLAVSRKATRGDRLHVFLHFHLSIYH